MSSTVVLCARAAAKGLAPGGREMGCFWLPPTRPCMHLCALTYLSLALRNGVPVAGQKRARLAVGGDWGYGTLPRGRGTERPRQRRVTLEL